MRSYIITLVACGMLFFISNGFVYAQEKEEQEGEMPEFMEMRRPNFKKIQRKAERYFKRKATQAREEEATLDTNTKPFEAENILGGREEDNEYHRYKRWEWYWRDRVNPDGSFPDPMKAFEVYKSVQRTNARLEAANPTWTSIGMKTNSGGYWGLGQARSVAVFPGNANIYYVTTVGGGIWKTTNGGASYTPIGDGLPQLFCGTVLVDQQDANIVYVNIGGTGEWWLAGLGVYKSTNGGATWTATGLTGTRANGINIKKMAMSPVDSKVILAATNKGLYRTTNGGTNWTVVRTGEHGDVVFRPGDGGTVYTASDDYWSGSEVFRSTDAGTNWTQETNLGKTKTKIWLGVTVADKEFVAAVFKTDGATKDLYISSDRGNNFTYRSNTMPDADIFYVSQLDKNIMYGAAVTMKQTRDGGNSWTEITNWCCGNDAVRTEVHADFHGATHNPLNVGELYFCNDGGVYKFNETTKAWTNLCNGLVITMYYRVATAQTNNTMLCGATQDNGGNARNANSTWRNTTGGDATMAMVDPTNENIQYSSYINGDGITRTNNAWSSDVGLTDALRNAGAVGGDWACPFAIDQTNPQNIVGAYQDVMRSTNRGDSWTKISNNLTNGGNLHHITIAPNDGKTIYTSRDATLYRTFNTGANWSNITSPGGNITRIVVSPTDAKTVYITTNGGNGKRIYRSTNGGDTWTNLTLNFPNDVNAICIAYEKGTNEGLYVGSPIGVFYKNASMSQWIYYGQGLPNTEVNDIAIAYGAKKIRVGTWGRGVWECDLYTDAVEYRDPENPSNVVNGINLDYYQQGYDLLPDFSQETPTWTGGVIPSFTTTFAHPADSFAVHYYGYIEVPTDGEYTFYTNSDDGTKLYIGSKLIVSNDGIHGMTEQSGSILLRKGKHAISLDYYERNGGDGLEVRYSGPSLAKQLIPNTVLYMPSLRTPDVMTNFVLNGLDYHYYEGSYTAMPDFSSLTPLSKGSIPQFTLDLPNRLGSHIAIRYTGYVDVANDGIYTFYCTTDDGSKLYIGNQLILNNDGIHGMVEVEGKIGLKKGRHAITLEYFQGMGGIGMEVRYSGAFLTKQIIPASALFRTIPLRTPDAPINTLVGISYALYDYTGNTVPNFSTLGNPKKAGSVSQINLTMTGKPADHYAIKYVGYVEVPEDGEYTFFTNSDDGSKLYIGTTMILNNDGLHTPIEKSGAIGLKKGKHSITVDYLEYDFGEALAVSYQGANIAKTIIPITALSFESSILAQGKAALKNNLVKIYPNPFLSKVHVDVHAHEVEALEFLTLEGKQVEGIRVSKEATSYMITVPQDVPDGMYMIQLQAEGATYSYKVMKK